MKERNGQERLLSWIESNGKTLDNLLSEIDIDRDSKERIRIECTLSKIVRVYCLPGNEFKAQPFFTKLKDMFNVPEKNGFEIYGCLELWMSAAMKEKKPANI